MRFTNPAGEAGENAAAYVRELLALLGERDPLEVQSELVPALQRLLAGLDGETLRKPEELGRWSCLQVVEHLADSEMVTGYRVRSILTESNPPLAGYDQDAWAARLGYRDARLQDVLPELAAMRARNLRLYRSLDEAQLDRAGVHAERGRESVRHVIRLIAAHDLVHRNQIERIKRAVGG